MKQLWSSLVQDHPSYFAKVNSYLMFSYKLLFLQTQVAIPGEIYDGTSILTIVLHITTKIRDLAPLNNVVEGQQQERSMSYQVGT